MRDFEPKTICILGRQPALGLAELESLYGAEHVQPIGGRPVKNSSNLTGQVALLDIEAGEINFQRLGGTLKVAKLLDILPTTIWRKIYEYLTANIPEHLKYVPAPTPQGRDSDPDDKMSGRRQDRRRRSVGKGGFTLGVSLYGLELPVSKLNADLLSLKKIIRTHGRSVRIVPNKTLELNSAQVLHNKLTRRGAWELLAIADAGRTYLAQTFFIQDIDAYAARDQARPLRDSRVGMLPPKLAQIIINLAVGKIEPSVVSRQSSVKKLTTKDSRLATTRSVRVLDPFCGTGVMLQEALLMGYSAIGSDINPRMVEYTRANLDWLAAKHKISHSTLRDEPSGSDSKRNMKYELEVADATHHKWQQQFDTVASELYLGRPLSYLPNPQKLNEIVQDVNTITKKFLSNIAAQIPRGMCLSLAVPAWRKSGKFIHLPTLDNLASLGYNRISLVHVRKEDLVYFREDQTVARELLVLTKN